MKVSEVIELLRQQEQDAELFIEYYYPETTSNYCGYFTKAVEPSSFEVGSIQSGKLVTLAESKVRKEPVFKKVVCIKLDND